MLEESILQEKYTDALYRLRNKLGHNEYHYYTKLYECATAKAEGMCTMFCSRVERDTIDWFDRVLLVASTGCTRTAVEPHHAPAQLAHR